MNGRRLPVLALIVSLLVPLGPAAAATPQVSVDNTASNTIAIGTVVNGDPANALVTVRNGHQFWAAIDLQPPLGGASLRAADVKVDVGGLYAWAGLIAPGATAAYQGTFDVSRGGSQTVHVHYDISSVGGAEAVAANLLTVIAYALGASMTAGSGWGPAAALQALMAAPGYADFLRAVQRPGDIWGLVSAIETLLGTQTGRAAIIAGLAQFGVTTTDAQLVVAGSLASVIRYVQMLVDLLCASWNGQTDGTTTFWLKAPTPTPTTTPTLGPPPAPTGVTYGSRSATPADAPWGTVGGYDTVTWSNSGLPTGTTVTVYGITKCYAPVNAPPGTPCLVLHTPLDPATMVVLGRVKTPVKKVTWTEFFGAGCSWARNDSVWLWAVVVIASNSAGQSRAVIAGTGTVPWPESVC